MRVRRRYHGSMTTMVLIAFAALLAVGAVNSQNNLLFVVLGITLASGVVSGFVSGGMMMAVRVERLAPHAGLVGSPTVFRYIVRNTSRWMPLFAIRIDEVDWSKRGGGSWRRILPTVRGFVAYVPARGSAEVVASVLPLRRGEARLSAVRVSSAFPFGLVRKSCTFEQAASVLVHPRVLRLRPDVTSNLVSRADVGKTASGLKGRGDEFYGLRDYTPGDSPRLIAWRSSARLGSLVVRENTAPAAGQVWVLLHLNDPQVGGDRREDAITLAASLVHHGATIGMEPGLAIVGSRVSIAPESGGRHQSLLMSALAMIDEPGARGENDPVAMSREASASIPPRATTIVVHAGAIDPVIGPAGARHVSAGDLASLASGSGEPRPSSRASEGDV